MSAIAQIMRSFGKSTKYDRYSQAQTLPQIISMAMGDYENARVFHLFGRDSNLSSSPAFHDVWSGGSAPALSSHKFHWPTAADNFHVTGACTA